ncbi:MAG: glucosamine-6-phosphate deaminase [Faecalibacterium sp.]|nr:glucosamine-6-phosphate deaminase [Ruminococcus sp.]MCM1392389.1 glucosamine-6-phosphate deaminase [Ruminococcus sp.]MCM1485905.1 glucosamine-6-phosphate deaminase [Faecalibacterium sp.]
MKIVLMDSAYDISKAVSSIIIEQIKSKPNSVLGFATGASPVETYKRIIESYEKGEVSLKDITTFNLDEYCGISQDNVNSYYYFMKDNLFGKTDVDFSKVNFLSGQSDDIESECSAYREKIKNAGGIDIQLLGVGRNGHIGFNEPADEFTDGPFKVQLTESTIAANSKYFENDDMPRYALTMGIGDIMNAKKILLIATGESKANAIYQMIKGEVSPQCPASILQNHPDCTIYVDKESAKLISE